MALTVDPINKRIILDSTIITATEIYSRVADWQALSDNLKWGMIIRQVGSDDLGSGLAIPPYYFLQGSWRVRPMEANHTLVISGNLFVEGGGIPVVPTLGNYNVSTQYTVPVQAQAFSTAGGTTDPWATNIEGSFTAKEVLRLLLAVQTGRSEIVPGGTTKEIIFKSVDGSKDRVVATMSGSKRTNITTDVT